MTTTETSYPFPDGEDNELKKIFNIDLREYSKEQKDAAAASWSEFCRNQLDAQMFVKLIAICEGSLAEATVLYDALWFHRKYGLKKFQERSAIYFINKYGKDFFVERTLRRGMQQLGESGLLVHWPVSTGFSRKFRIDWIELSDRLILVSKKLPGLTTYEGDEA